MRGGIDMRRLLVRVVTVVQKSGLYLSMLLALIMALHVTAEIVGRRFFNYPLPGTIEIVSYFYMVSVSFLPLGYSQAVGEHVSADAFLAVIPRRLRPYAEWLGKLLSVVVCIILLWATTQMAIQQTLLGEAVQSSYFDIPVWWTRWLVPFGLLSMVMVMLAQMFLPEEMQERQDPQPEF
jgi:TRAP-type C4-dicarboxylate transport system permease small subunit